MYPLRAVRRVTNQYNMPKQLKKSPRSKSPKGTPKPRKKFQLPEHLQQINLNAAGIDLGGSEHWVCVPAGRDQRPVRSFAVHTYALKAMAQWLLDCGVDTAAMEATGVYWIPVFQVLESYGLKVYLVNARQIKNVDGRKTDLLDCQWIQQLHTYGLLRSSFRPEDQICVLRSYLRHHQSLIEERSVQIQHMQKALQQMNVLVHKAVSDITGLSGLAMVRAIVAGQRDPLKLANLAHRRVRKTTAQIAEYLTGDYRQEHLFVLTQALELYDIYNQKIFACEERIQSYLASLDTHAPAGRPLPPTTKARSGSRAAEQQKNQQRAELHRVMGVDLTAIEGIGVLHAQTILSEIGWSVEAWRSEKHFASWLGACPDNRISGGRVLSVRTRRVKNRVMRVLRLAASSLEHSQSGLGVQYRRFKAKLGPAAAIVAMAHKLARLIYRLLKHGEAYVAQGQQDYDKKVRERQLKQLQKHAANMGYELIARPEKA